MSVKIGAVLATVDVLESVTLVLEKSDCGSVVFMKCEVECVCGFSSAVEVWLW